MGVDQTPRTVLFKPDSAAHRFVLEMRGALPHGQRVKQSRSGLRGSALIAGILAMSAVVVPAQDSAAPEIVKALRTQLPTLVDTLVARNPVHIVAIGDETLTLAGPRDESPDEAWPAMLARELAREFFYTGGVDVVQGHQRPAAERPDRPAIHLRLLTQRDLVANQGLSLLMAQGLQPRPHAVLLAVGRADLHAGGDTMFFMQAMHHFVQSVRALKADVLLASPPSLAEEPLLESAAAANLHASLLRDQATDDKAAFIDLSAEHVLREDTSLKTIEALALTVPHFQEHVRLNFAWDKDKRDLKHPTPGAHRRYAGRAWAQLTRPAPAAPWTLTEAHAAMTGSDGLEVRIKVKSHATKARTIRIEPLPFQAWICRTPTVSIEIAPDATQTITLTYRRNDEADSFLWPAFAAHEPMLRLPLLISDGKRTRTEVARAMVGPLALLWKLDTAFNVEGKIALEQLVLNTTDTALPRVPWEAEWAGQKRNGTLSIDAQGSALLPLSFDLPSDASVRRVASPVVIRLIHEGNALRWSRAMEASRNIGLKSITELLPEAAGNAEATLQVEADKTALRLHWQMKSVAPGAVYADVHLDARSFGKRLTLGTCAPLSLLSSASQPITTARAIAPWAFGTGYGMKFDPHAVTAEDKTLPDGSRSFTVTIPRSYLYLHEWAIGNGNSQLGLRATLHAGNAKFSLSQQGRAAHDAQGYTVLELTDKPTARWSAVLW